MEIRSVTFWDKHENNNGGIKIEWSSEKGFGQFYIFLNKENKLMVDDEYMGKEEVSRCLTKLLEEATLVR